MKESPTDKLIKKIVESINWQNKRIYEIEKLLRSLVKKGIATDDEITTYTEEEMTEIALNALNSCLNPSNDDTDGEQKE